MQRRTMIFLAAGVAFLMAICAVLGLQGGMPASARRQVEDSQHSLTSAEGDLAEKAARIESWIESEPNLFQRHGYDGAWRKSLAAARARLVEADTMLGEAKTLLEAGDRSQRVEIEQRANRAARIAEETLAEIEQIETTAKQRIDLKQNFATNVERLENDHRAVQTVDLAGLRAEVEKAGADWPAKRATLVSRLAELEEAKSKADAALEKARQAGARPGSAPNDIDYEAVAQAQSELRALASTAVGGRAALRDQIDQLYVSWDKILADMEIREGAEVTFHHKVKKVTTDTRLAESDKNATRETEAWKKVAKSEYLAMEKNLGMVLEHKATGKFDSEAEKKVQAPGYAYVARPGQRNRYGYWENRGGNSFWVFYGQYAFMRNVFWGGSYRPIQVPEYRGYRDSYDRGRTWYGRDTKGKPRYGSSGSYTTSRYKSSKFKTSDGFKSTQFKRSGGTYRGSRYSTPSSRGRSGSYSGSRYSGGRSSFGSRSSFGGSRFGGGK